MFISNVLMYLSIRPVGKYPAGVELVARELLWATGGRIERSVTR
jgi:hypothetical protein